MDTPDFFRSRIDTMTPHGFRAMARTIMVERLNVVPEVIEAQLAHAKAARLELPMTAQSSWSSGGR